MASTSTTTQVLMRKGKRGAAAYIQADCAGGSPSHLGSLLDSLLNPVKAIDEWETIDWCKWLMAGGRTPDEFSSIVRSYDNHAKCGLVWIPHVVAYRCRTCGISPCMSICRECFKLGDHSTHDFNMFLSQAGGACDCGDTSVMKETGFCSNHGLNNCSKKSPAPADLMCVAEAMMPRIILRLLQHFRENSTSCRSDSYRSVVQDCDAYVAMLMEFNNMGELMRRVMTKTLINPQMYRNLVEPPFADTEYGRYLEKSKAMYEAALEAFPSPSVPEEYRKIPALGQKLIHKTLLEEFIFWTFKFEFPQNVVCFLLNMLPDQDYKEHLTRTFVMHYSRIPLVLERSNDPDPLSNRVVHMSVQLFSNESLALKMVNELSLLHVMIISLKVMMSKILVQNTLHDPNKNFHLVIDCAQRVMKEHCYWPLVSDFNNVLSHKSVALVFLRDNDLIDMWFQFLSMLQGMNVNIRERNTHVEFEPSSYYAAFSCELEASAYPMWSIISHMTDSSYIELAKKMISFCVNYLDEWLVAVDFPKVKDEPYIDKYQLVNASFHFPLHRYLAAFTSQAVRAMGVPLNELLPSTHMLAELMIHPLRVQSLFYEILSGVWVRNGLQIKGQAMTYIQANFCNSMVDMDIFFLQLCATNLTPHKVLKTTIDLFGISEWLTVGQMAPAQELEQDSMMEGFLTFLATLISCRTNMGNDELTQSRLEISSLLATGDKTHSQLLELMPERSGNAHTRNFETVLKQLSTYRPPPRGSENLEQGLFVPLPEVWEHHYDPLHVLLRAVHRRDFQSSMDRFSAYVKQEYKTTTTLWPPFRLPKDVGPGYTDPSCLLHSRVLHSTLLGVFHRAVHSQNVSEHVLALAVFLLEMAVISVVPSENKAPICQITCSGSASFSGSPNIPDILNCFPGDCLSENLRTVVQRVAMEPPPEQTSPANYTFDSDVEWDISETEISTPVASSSPVRMLGGTTISSNNAALVVPPPRDLAVPQDLSIVPEQSLALPEDIEMTPEDPLALALPEDNTPIEIDPTQLALPSTENETTGMEVAIRGEVTEVAGQSGPPALLSGSEICPTGSLFLPFARVHPVAVPNHNSDIIPSGPGQRKPSNKRRPVEGTSNDAFAISINESIISLLLKLHSQLSGTLDSFSLDEDIPTSIIQCPDTQASNSQFESTLSMDTTNSTDISNCSCNDSQSNYSNNPTTSKSNCDKYSCNKCDKNVTTDRYEGRIGDGPYFIGNLLRKIAALDTLCAQNISDIRRRLWPHQREKQAEQRAKETREKEERSQRARERQQRMMQEFANRQKKFMEQVMESEEGQSGGMDWRDDEEEEEDTREKEYDCIICNITSPSSEVNPIGLVVLVQSTSVVGYRRKHPERLPLPISDEDNTGKDSTLSAIFDTRLKEMMWQFDSSSCMLSVNLGWEGGVHVQSCGHHVHLACHKLYLQSLTNAQRSPHLHIDRGEFLCPVCRQLSNSVLPLSPQLGKPYPIVKSPTPDLNTLATDMLGFLKNIERPANSSLLSEAMFKAMEDMTNSTHLKFKSKSASPSHQSLFLFVNSIARINIEAEIVERGGSLCTNNIMRYKPKRDCIVPLIHVLSVHARVLAEWPSWHTWSAISGVPLQDDPVPTAAGHKNVPLLLRDPCALLFKFVLFAPLHLDLVICQLSCNLSESERAWALERRKSGSVDDIGSALGLVLMALGHTALYEADAMQPSTSMTTTEVNLRALEQQLQRLCLPFLRVASMLRHHLYGEQLPEISTPQVEFVRLVYYLELVTKSSRQSVLNNHNESPGMDWDVFNAATALSWLPKKERVLPILWCEELGTLVSRSQILARSLMVEQHVVWQQPRLLSLPKEYERLFTYYHERACGQCHSVPKESSICMMCGTVVCLKQNCCRQQDVCEAVQHSIDCGGGTGIFLVVTSTYIIIIRGRRACLWGSLYLDDYDEEDRDLKRGKPLYLSEDRFNLLESQWLSHRFDHTKRAWVWHRDSL